jgi:hypothetical protein
VAIEHLFLGTTADNIADKLAKNRQAKGENAGGAKLTQEKVKEIRDRYAAGDVSTYQLAREYGVNNVNVWYIIKRQTWKHVL